MTSYSCKYLWVNGDLLWFHLELNYKWIVSLSCVPQVGRFLCLADIFEHVRLFLLRLQNYTKLCNFLSRPEHTSDKIWNLFSWLNKIKQSKIIASIRPDLSCFVITWNFDGNVWNWSQTGRREEWSCDELTLWASDAEFSELLNTCTLYAALYVSWSPRSGGETSELLYWKEGEWRGHELFMTKWLGHHRGRKRAGKGLKLKKLANCGRSKDDMFAVE